MKIININRDGFPVQMGTIDVPTVAQATHLVGTFGERRATAGGDSKHIQVTTFEADTPQGRAFGFRPEILRRALAYGKRANYRLFKTAAARDAAVASYLASARKDCK